MKNTPASTILAVILLLLGAFTAISICFIGSFADYLSSFLEATGQHVANHTAIVWAYGALLAIPCAVILLMALKLPGAVKQDRIFTVETAALLARIALIFCVDCILLLGAVVLLLLIGELLVSPLLALIDLIGFALAFLLHVLADYVRRAAILKEEADATL
ncbi:MAG: DUF2975 domain-containing protein [Clostridia bacterium]|nr:DUF2975 domain-containing protein [Clostridia bacterium]